ncbi:alpha/beta hydrolase [Chitinophaga barathri]|nr:alpha/beta hydrolase fold domain-containing protein [Chitinophaga barathri]
MRWIFILMLFSCSTQAQKRITYAVKGNDTLYIDHYEPTTTPNGMSIMFVHGGGFTAGDPKNQRPFAEGMCKKGYNVFVISYRLYLKGGSFGCNTATPVKLKAISTAVEDAADAAKYIITNAATLKVDTSKFFISGSSAGAETILQLLYNPWATTDKARYDYFATPRFKGALVFAGALIDINTLKQDNWVPMLLMHGTKDQLVPYGTASHHYCSANSEGWLMLFGAKTILEQAKTWNKPAVLYTYPGKGHEVANYMFREFDKMDAFMQDVVKGKQIKAEDVIVEEKTK